MSDPSALINTGEWAKPVDTLINKIANAVGGTFKPQQMRRVAKAESEVAIIEATTQIKITELERRAMYRLLSEQANLQNNMESIIRLALPEVNEQAKPEQIENDWVINFFDKCRLISDEEMQVLWARILASEANSPHTFSKRTINLLSELDKSEALLFTTLCSFGVNLEVGDITPLIYKTTNNKIYSEQGIDFSALQHLTSIGLIHFADSLVSFGLDNFNPAIEFAYYFDNKIYFDTPIETIDVGTIMFTQAGVQLSSICKPQSQKGFLEFIKENWNRLGYISD